MRKFSVLFVCYNLIIKASTLSTAQKYQIVQQDYDGISNWYDTELSSTQEFGAQLHDFTSSLPKNAAILDVGAGTGEESNYITQHGALVTALDMSPQMLAVLQRKYPQIKTQEGNMVHLPFDDGEFDGIWSARSIIHIPQEDLPKVLGQFHRVLKAGGSLSLVFAIPQNGTLQEELIPEHEAPDSEGLFYYRTLYPVSHMIDRLNQIGFRVVKQETLVDKMGKGELNAYLRLIKNR